MQENSTKAHISQKNNRNLKNGTYLLNCTITQSTLQKARVLYQINKQLPSILPSPINQHCWLMDFHTHIVTFGIDAAEWLIHMHQQEYHLKSYLRDQINLNPSFKIKYLVRPQHTYRIQTDSKTNRLVKISSKNKQFLKTVAKTLSDERLKTALLKLATD